MWNVGLDELQARNKITGGNINSLRHADVPSTFYTKSSRSMPRHVPCAQLCPTLCDPMDSILCTWDVPGKHTGVVCYFLLQGIFSIKWSNPVFCIAGRLFTRWVMGKALLGYMDDTTLMAKSKEELKNLLIRVKEESEKDSLKLNIKKTKIMASGPITSWKTEEEKVETVTDFLFLGSKTTADGDCSHEIRKQFLLGRKKLWQMQTVLKSKDHFANKGLYSKGYSLSSSHIWLWELDHKEGRGLTFMSLNCGAGEDSWESLGQQADQTNLEWNQPWIFIVRTDADPKAPVLCQPDANSQLIGINPYARKDWGQKEKRATEDEMIGWHHQCNGHDLGQILGDGEGQGYLACYSPWGWEQSDTTWLLNNSQYRGL